MHPDVYKRPLLWALVILITLLSFFYQPVPGKQDVFHAISKKEVKLTGRVESFAVHKQNSNNVIVKITSLDNAPASGRVYARFRGESPAWKDEITFTGVLQVPYGIELPGHFDWKRYLALQHVFTEVKSESFVQERKANFFFRLIRRLRQSILQTLEDAFPSDLAAIAGGVLLGQRSEMTPSLHTAFQDSGAIHLLVASGGNVGFVTLLILLVGSWLRLQRRVLLLIALAAAGFYTLIAGAEAPLVRAYLMAVGACVGYFLGRNSGVFQGLLLSCFIILLCNPISVLDIGFQMSFLATLAIIICLTNYQPPATWPRYARFFMQIFLATLSSQLALLPIFTNVFYKVSLTGLISNMILVPFASVLIVLVFVYYVACLLHLGIILYFPCLWSLELFKTLVTFFASFPFSAISVTAWHGGSIVAYYSLLFVLFHLPNRKFTAKIIIPCLAVCLFSLLVGVIYQHKDRVYLLSEWDHRAVIVRTQGQVFVFNSGLSQKQLKQSLAALGIEEPTAFFALGFDKEIKTSFIYPFRDIWPGSSVNFDRVRVQAVWELHQTQDKRVWQEIGYSGQKKEGISYCIQTKKDILCIGQQARFVQINDSTLIEGRINQTVSSAW